MAIIQYASGRCSLARRAIRFNLAGMAGLKPLFHCDSNDFPRRYEALLRNGYDAHPDALLQTFVGVSLADPALIASATTVLESWLRELEGLYKS